MNGQPTPLPSLPQPDHAGSSRSADRALLRIGARTARRNPLRSVLIVALLALPIATAITVAGAQRALSPSVEVQESWHFGNAEWVIDGWSATGAPAPIPMASGASVEGGDAVLAWLADHDLDELAAFFADAVDAESVVSSWSTVFVSGDQPVEVRSLDAGDPLVDPLTDLVEGRYAVGPEEATLTARLAARLDVAVGDELAMPDGDPVSIVGIHEVPSNARSLSLLLDRSDPPEGAAMRFFIGGVGVDEPLEAKLAAALAEETGVPRAFDAAWELGALSPSRADWQFGTSRTPLDLDRPPVLSGVVAALLLVEVALIAAAAFTTGARRRLHEFGLLATIGADDRHVRRLVLAEAFVLGAVGAMVGVALGVVATRLVTPLVAEIASHHVGTVGSRWSEVLAPAVLGVVAAVVAAWFPARTVARVAPLTALTGRMPTRPLRARVIPAGLACIALGLAVTAGQAAGVRNDPNGLGDGALVLIVLGALSCLAGSALLASWVVARVGRSSDRLPLSLRLVARDAARQQFRSAVAIAGLVVVTAIPVIIGAVAVTEAQASAGSDSGRALDDEIVVGSWSSAGAGSSEQDQAAAQVEADVAWLRSVLPVASEGRLVLLGTDVDGVAQEAFAWDPGARGAGGSSPVALGTDEAVAALRLPASAADALADGRVVAIGTESDTVGLSRLIDAPDGRFGQMETVEFPGAAVVDDRPFSWLTPAFLIPPALADDLGLVGVRSQTVLVLDGPITAGQIDAIELRHPVLATLELRSLGPADEWVTTSISYASDDSGADLLLVQAIALAATTLVVLVIGGCLVAVAATESDHDLATMVRVGAAPSLRRGVLAIQSWYHAVLGAVLAVPVGLLLLVSLRQALFDPPPLALPWLSMVAVIVVVPLTLAVVVGLATRSLRTPR